MGFFRQELALRALGSDSDQGGTAEGPDDVDEMAILAFGACSGRLVPGLGKCRQLRPSCASRPSGGRRW